MLQRGGLRHRWPAGSSSGVWRVVKLQIPKALSNDLTQPFGKVLLGLVAIGLIGYVLWRFVQAIKDPEKKARTSKVWHSLGYAVNGLIYAGFSAVAGSRIGRRWQ